MKSSFLKRLATKLTVISMTFFLGVMSSSVLTSKQPTVPVENLKEACRPESSQTSEPHGVVDYYLLLPDQYFEANEEQRVNWMLNGGRGAVVDLDHGYIYAPGDGAQTDIYVRLFERPNQGPLIAVKSYASDSQDFTYLDFFEYKDGGLYPVNVAPVTVNERFRVELPRVGNTINVSNAQGSPLYDLVWSQTEFKVKRR
jgi:hypothetical protein